MIHKMLRTLTILTIVIFIFACKNKISTPESRLYDHVMAVHDEVMPKMSDIYKARKKLKKIDIPDLESRKNELIQELEMADEAMMEWMRQFDKPTSENIDENMAYLQDEKIKIEQVSVQMLKAIEQANTFINQNQ